MYVQPGNVHDSNAYTRLRCWYGEEIKDHVVDAGYVTPAICKLVKDNKQELYIPYKRPMTKKGFFKKYEYVYDEYYDCYICPNEKIIEYVTTNRKGYKEYPSNPRECRRCPYLRIVYRLEEATESNPKTCMGRIQRRVSRRVTT